MSRLVEDQALAFDNLRGGEPTNAEGSMGNCAKPNICHGLFTTIFFVQRQQKSISASIPAKRNSVNTFNFF